MTIFPFPQFPCCTPPSGGPRLPWWHSTGWRCLEIMTTGGSGEAEPEWWLASEECPVWAERQHKRERMGGRAALNKSCADATRLQPLAIRLPNNAQYQTAVHCTECTCCCQVCPFLLPFYAPGFKRSKYLLLVSILAVSSISWKIRGTVDSHHFCSLKYLGLESCIVDSMAIF